MWRLFAKKNAKLAIRILGASLMVASVLAALAIRFSFPEMTETQLLIHFFCYWIIIAIATLSGLAMSGAK